MDNNPVNFTDRRGLKVKADPRPRPKDGQITIGGVGYTTEKVNRLLSKKESDVNPVFGKLHKIFHGHKDKFKQIKPKEFTIYTDEKTGEQYNWDYDDDGAIVFYKLIPKAPAEQKEEQTHAEAEKIEMSEPEPTPPSTPKPRPKPKPKFKGEELKKDDKPIYITASWYRAEHGAPAKDGDGKYVPLEGYSKSGNVEAGMLQTNERKIRNEIRSFIDAVNAAKDVKTIEISLNPFIGVVTGDGRKYVNQTTLPNAYANLVQYMQDNGLRTDIKIEMGFAAGSEGEANNYVIFKLK